MSHKQCSKLESSKERLRREDRNRKETIQAAAIMLRAPNRCSRLDVETGG